MTRDTVVLVDPARRSKGAGASVRPIISPGWGPFSTSTAIGRWW
ncbi:hypothetical protein I551_3001 [Mycobacterium ulcerans str. Harvey]|uniref:Uncharacterized protein n=1 Tax=Mycobacterium ulcerans str. Harvey TaxID=1299332 RepID=A0ABP3AK90_MYCUL|nr:hypothetical protein I551_3001 [Mycobacterium ulcerans str. Harvey]